MLLSSKFSRFSSKSIRLATNACANKRIGSRNENHFHTLSNNTLLKLRISGAGCNHGESAARFSSKAEEVPWLPPPPPPESDVFGTIGGLKYETVELDEDERKEEERLKTLGGRVPRKLKSSLGEYAEMIKMYLSKGDLESAENVITECRKNRDRPSAYMFTLLMKGYADQGDVINAYKHFHHMRTLKYKIKGNTYTTLFNACANSQLSDKALNYLEKSRKFMIEQGEQMNHAHYNVMVRAYGKHQKYDEAMKLLQQMMDRKMKIGISTLNSMMFAANSNVESGLKHVLHIWQLMRKLAVPPDMFTYNLLLRAIRDTHFGDCTVQQLYLPDADCPVILTDNNRPDLLLYPPVISSLPLKNIHRKKEPEKLLLEAPQKETDSSESTESSDANDTSASSKQRSLQVLPAEIADLNLDAILAQNKLILFGGIEGIISKMKNDRIKPSIKTVTFLMELVPDSVAAENEVIKFARAEGIKFDVDFFNMLIKKRAFRGAKKEAKEILDELRRCDLKPNIVTYGVLALVCNTPQESRQLMQAMRDTGHTLNMYVADTLLKSAFLRRDFYFMMELMEIILKERVRLTEETYEKLDTFQQKMTELVKRKDPKSRTEYFKVGFAKFNLRYKTWQEEMKRRVVTERVTKEKEKPKYRL